MELHKSQDTAQLPSDVAKNVVDSKQKAEKNSLTMATVKPSGKNSKVAGEAQNEDYIHVRARRGQATNSHSLAERVRLLPFNVALIPIKGIKEPKLNELNLIWLGSLTTESNMNKF